MNKDDFKFYIFMVFFFGLLFMCLVIWAYESDKVEHSEGIEGSKVPKTPDYLDVYYKYKGTELYNDCENYALKIKDQSNSELFNSKPFKVDTDMDILSYSLIDDKHVFKVECVIIAYHQLSALQIVKKEYRNDLGSVEISLHN